MVLTFCVHLLAIVRCDLVVSRWGLIKVHYLSKFQLFFNIMGSFRSQPDTNKHSVSKEGPGFTYSVSHMCGKKALT